MVKDHMVLDRVGVNTTCLRKILQICCSFSVSLWVGDVGCGGDNFTIFVVYAYVCGMKDHREEGGI